MNGLYEAWMNAQSGLPDFDDAVDLRLFKAASGAEPVEFPEGRTVSRQQFARLLSQMQPGGSMIIGGLRLVLNNDDQIVVTSTGSADDEEDTSGYYGPMGRMAKSANQGGHQRSGFGDALLAAYHESDARRAL